MVLHFFVCHFVENPVEGFFAHEMSPKHPKKTPLDGGRSFFKTFWAISKNKFARCFVSKNCFVFFFNKMVLLFVHANNIIPGTLLRWMQAFETNLRTPF